MNVVIAAGGLGTRAHTWTRFIPKEFYPLDGRPGILHLFDEIQTFGSARICVVYHPYYEPFIEWIRHLLDGGVDRYDHLARRPVPEQRRPMLTGLNVSFRAERGCYSDLSSVLTAADWLTEPRFLVAFADNLYLDANPLNALTQAVHDGPALLARPFTIAEAHRRGVIIAPVRDGRRYVVDIVEKPSPAEALALLLRWGQDTLYFVEGRFLLTSHFLAGIDQDLCRAAGEPKLSLALGHYARSHPVAVVVTASRVVDLASHQSQPDLIGITP